MDRPLWISLCTPAPAGGADAEVLRSLSAGAEPEWVRDALAERLGPLLHRRLGAAAVPGPESLRRAFLTSVAADAYQTAWLDEILCALAAQGTAAALLKGAWLAEAVYSDPALRPRTDLDLLVAPRNLLGVHEALTSLGLGADGDPRAVGRALAAPERAGPLCSLEYREPERRFSCHVHWGLVNASAPLPHAARVPDAGALLSAAREVETPRGRRLELPPAFHLCHLVEHLTRPGHPFRPLLRVVDLPWVVHRFGNRVVEEAADLARFWGIERLFGGALAVASRLLGVPSFAGVRARARAENPGLAALRLHLAGCGSLPGRLRFLARSVVPHRDAAERCCDERRSFLAEVARRGVEGLALVLGRGA
ncbi:MAG: nucleotidyltransferase family protein [Deltaproteobacteria bacterium]|nr:nucleotidyltransferase family protein [Deltaproteobacteria bacterium]